MKKKKKRKKKRKVRYEKGGTNKTKIVPFRI